MRPLDREDASPEVKRFHQHLRQEVLPLRPSQYDISDTCNLFCEGCLFFAGSDHAGRRAADDLEAVDRFFAGEAARGVNYAEVAGAEPSLVEDKLVIMTRHIPHGVIYTNGTKKLTAEITHRLQISLWGLPKQSEKLRGADVVAKQVKNYRDDPRAIFVFTVTGDNVATIPDIVRFCADEGMRLSFNHYSPTESYLARLPAPAGARDDYFRFSDENDNLLLSRASLARSKDLIDAAMEQYPRTVLYDRAFNAWIHDPGGLHDLDPGTGVATHCACKITKSYRHFHADLTDAGEVKCATPNIACDSCRLYAQSLGTLLARRTRPALQGDGFEEWVRLWRLWYMLFWGNLPAEFDPAIAAPHRLAATVAEEAS